MNNKPIVSFHQLGGSYASFLCGDGRFFGHLFWQMAGRARTCESHGNLPAGVYSCAGSIPLAYSVAAYHMQGGWEASCIQHSGSSCGKPLAYGWLGASIHVQGYIPLTYSVAVHHVQGGWEASCTRVAGSLYPCAGVHSSHIRCSSSSCAGWLGSLLHTCDWEPKFMCRGTFLSHTV